MVIGATLWDSNTLFIHFQLELSCRKDCFGNHTRGCLFVCFSSDNWSLEIPQKAIGMNVRGSATFLDVEGVLLPQLTHTV